LADKYYFLWAKSDCEWCIKAADLLNTKAISYTTFTMDKQQDLLKEVKENFKWETVPIILEVSSNGQTNFVGGYDDLEKHLS